MGMPNMWIDTHGIADHMNTARDTHRNSSDRPETARLTYWEHKAVPRQNRSALELPKYADGTRICAKHFEGVEKI